MPSPATLGSRGDLDISKARRGVTVTRTGSSAKPISVTLILFFGAMSVQPRAGRVAANFC